MFVTSAVDRSFRTLISLYNKLAAWANSANRSHAVEADLVEDYKVEFGVAPQQPRQRLVRQAQPSDLAGSRRWSSSRTR